MMMKCNGMSFVDTINVLAIPKIALDCLIEFTPSCVVIELGKSKERESRQNQEDQGKSEEIFEKYFPPFR
jgi:hypothetical protein